MYSRDTWFDKLKKTYPTSVTSVSRFEFVAKSNGLVPSYNIFNGIFSMSLNDKDGEPFLGSLGVAGATVTYVGATFFGQNTVESACKIITTHCGKVDVGASKKDDIEFINELRSL